MDANAYLATPGDKLDDKTVSSIFKTDDNQKIYQDTQEEPVEELVEEPLEEPLEEPVQDSQEEKNEEEEEPVIPVLTGLLAKTFKELEEEAPTNPEVAEYLATFHQSVIDALRETSTPSGALPFRGAMTLRNLANLIQMMPDLYDYLKESFSAIESCGDADINAILDAADDADYSKIEAMGIERCRSFVNDYIADTYYNQYLPGYTPIAFSIDDWYPPQEDFIILPRKNWWWHDMKTKTWQEYN